MTCRNICAVCTCGRAATARPLPINGDFRPNTRPEKIARKDFRKAAEEAGKQYKASMKILA
ncbi:hypothetical protein [Pararhodobacter marinus]|uniref:hypothetical protein n=1 Tax=Pararhodobacter marinus TaxID=2184063 RepID=UPI0035184D0F